MIDGSTRLYGILGSPVSHSLSPAIYNALFQAAGANRVYLPLEVTSADLDLALKALKILAFDGFNVTTPHKEQVVAHLDELIGPAQELGCVNTIHRDGDLWKGYNTDGAGLRRWLEERRGVDLSSRRILVLGAGHAARSILLALGERKPEALRVLNRTWARFESSFFEKHRVPLSLELIGADRTEPASVYADSDLVINATSFGLGGEGSGTPGGLPGLEQIGAACLAVDTNYGSRGPTPFMKALPGGIESHDGRGMLLHLAGEAYRIFTGAEPDLEPAASLLRGSGDTRLDPNS